MDNPRSELQDSTIPRCPMHDSGLHCRCLDAQDACCDCTAHVCEDGEVRVYDECNLVLCETCAEDAATDCSEIAKAEGGETR